MIYYSQGNENLDLSGEDLKSGLFKALSKLGQRKKILVIPPDYTRFHSRAGELTGYVREFYGNRLEDILPALGTHSPMTEKELSHMFKGIPHSLFREHKWRTDVITLGEVPSSFIKEVSEGKVNYAWPAQVNKLLRDGGHDLILSIGQVVPHEVTGFANHNKSIFVGTGGSEGINKSHFLGAAYGMERMMGRAVTPVRKVLDYASDHFAKELPIVYILTVLGKDREGRLKTRGLYIGDGNECFLQAADLSFKVNFEILDNPLKKVVVYLDPSEFKSTWLGNKSIYRTRMALDDSGELIVLAPGLKEFGEDIEIDRLIRKYGYVNTPEILHLTEKNEDLKNNLSAAAHLIHGSTEGRFRVTYCPGKLSRKEIESVNYSYADLDKMIKIFDPGKLKDGFNNVPGQGEIFYISNPALGLWAYRERFK